MEILPVLREAMEAMNTALALASQDWWQFLPHAERRACLDQVRGIRARAQAAHAAQQMTTVERCKTAMVKVVWAYQRRAEGTMR